MLLLAPALLMGIGEGEAASLRLESQTILRGYERNVRLNQRSDEDRFVAPLYEYLQVDVEDFAGDELTFHAYGWGRQDLPDSDFFEDNPEGELLYAYAQYLGSEDNLTVRIGRQYLFPWTVDDAVDGVYAAKDILPWLSLEAFGGLPVALWETHGPEGDAAFGLRAVMHEGSRWRLGLFYGKLLADGDSDEEELGLDVDLSLPMSASLGGRSVYSLQTGGFAEHFYAGSVPLGSVTLSPSFEYFSLDDFLNDRENSSTVFRVLAEENEVITSGGLDAVWRAAESLDLGARARVTGYERRDDTALYGGALATWRFEEFSELGAELGRTDGDADDSRYWLMRAYAYKSLPPGFVSLDVVYAAYDKDIEGEGGSFFVSLGGGRKFLDDALELKAVVDYSSDPYFDSDLRAWLGLGYRTSFSFGTDEE